MRAKKLVDSVVDTPPPPPKRVSGNSHLYRLLKAFDPTKQWDAGGEGGTGTVVDFRTERAAREFVVWMKNRGYYSVTFGGQLGDGYVVHIYW
jgi:hypothetical protein